MKKKTKVSIIIWACIALIGLAGYILIGNSIVFINNQKLQNSVQSIGSEMVQLNDVVPFEWDFLYTFDPYQSKEEIEKLVGFKSADIKENNINEGMVHLLFVKGDKVVTSILGYDSNLGYRTSGQLGPKSIGAVLVMLFGFLRSTNENRAKPRRKFRLVVRQ